MKTEKNFFKFVKSNDQTFGLILTSKLSSKFPRLQKNEKKFIKDVKRFEEVIKKECKILGLTDDKIKELIWNTIKELQKNKIATKDEINNFLKARPEYLEFI